MVMIILCPFCGHSLPNGIIDGITSCSNCRRIFTSTAFNRILSAAWQCRCHYSVSNLERLLSLGFTKKEAKLVVELVVEECLCHDDLVKKLKELDICEEYELCVDRAG